MLYGDIINENKLSNVEISPVNILIENINMLGSIAIINEADSSKIIGLIKSIFSKISLFINTKYNLLKANIQKILEKIKKSKSNSKPDKPNGAVKYKYYKTDLPDVFVIHLDSTASLFLGETINKYKDNIDDFIDSRVKYFSGGRCKSVNDINKSVFIRETEGMYGKDCYDTTKADAIDTLNKAVLYTNKFVESLKSQKLEIDEKSKRTIDNLSKDFMNKDIDVNLAVKFITTEANICLKVLDSIISAEEYTLNHINRLIDTL